MVLMAYGNVNIFIVFLLWQNLCYSLVLVNFATASSLCFWNFRGRRTVDFPEIRFVKYI